MGDLKVDSMVGGSSDNVIEDFSVAPDDTDSTSDQDETEFINSKWQQQYGYFKTIPEINAAINAKSTWTIGKGFKADEITTMLLDTLKGWGKTPSTQS